MSETLSLSGSDRLLIIAPHPDDESIAAGGLLQVAQAAGAALRVIVLTDGDNNPWPQRWIEKRWRIDAAARARWGARRREEGEAALRVLGIARDDVRFLALPDGGITDILMRNDRSVIAQLRDECASFAPTMLVAPALSDRHPDHSAAFILATQACLAANVRLERVLTFAVHGDAPMEGGVVVALSEAQRQIKYDAIRAHASQMRLSDRRFLKFAQTQECYRWLAQPPQSDLQIPVTAHATSDSLQIDFDHRHWRTLRGHALFVVGELDGQPIRWRVPLAPRERPQLMDTITGKVVGDAAIQRHQRVWRISIPVRGVLTSGFVKIGRYRPSLWVFDRFGWQPIE